MKAGKNPCLSYATSRRSVYQDADSHVRFSYLVDPRRLRDTEEHLEGGVSGPHVSVHPHIEAESQSADQSANTT